MPLLGDDRSMVEGTRVCAFALYEQLCMSNRETEVFFVRRIDLLAR